LTCRRPSVSRWTAMQLNFTKPIISQMPSAKTRAG